MSLPDEVVEVANLVEWQTGVPGIIRISTGIEAQSAHVVYLREPGTQSVFSVSISDEAHAIASCFPEDLSDAPNVCAWVRLNHGALTDFWLNGDSWTDPEVTAFKAGLRKI